MSTQSMLPLPEYFLAAKKRLETHGWTKNIEEDARGRCCLVGALKKIGPRFGVDAEFSREVMWSALEAVDPDQQHSIMRIGYWNDKPGRTKEEVLAALELAAYLAA